MRGNYIKILFGNAGHPHNVSGNKSRVFVVKSAKKVVLTKLLHIRQLSLFVTVQFRLQQFLCFVTSCFFDGFALNFNRL